MAPTASGGRLPAPALNAIVSLKLPVVAGSNVVASMVYAPAVSVRAIRELVPSPPSSSSAISAPPVPEPPPQGQKRGPPSTSGRLSRSSYAAR